MRSSFLWLALLCHVALATGYAWSTPDFEGPDENSHYEYAWHIANAGKLPLTPQLAQERSLPQTEGAVLAHHPPLYYALVGAVLKVTDTDDTVFGPRLNPAFGNPGSAARHLRFLHQERPSRVLFLLRMVSVLLGALTIVCVHRLGRVCCPDAPRVGDLAALLTACLPMWSFLHGVLNSDVLAALLSSVTLLALVTLLRTPRVTIPQALTTGTLLGLAWLAKLTTLFLGGAAAVVALVLLRRAMQSGSVRHVLGAIGVVVAITLAISGWWFWRNYTLYADPLGMSAHDQAFQPIPVELRWHYFFGTDPWPNAVPSFLPTVFTSLFGRFGWFRLPPHPALVWCGAVIAGIAILGLLRAAFDDERRHLPRPMWLLWLAAGLVFAGTAWFNLSAPQPQARLLFPAVAPGAVLLAAGLDRITTSAPLRRWLLLLFPITAGIVLFTSFRPAFGPALAPAPIEHRSLVGSITSAVTDPEIIWTEPLSAEPLSSPPTLRWRDPMAPAGTRYTLYASDEHGRVWLATHEWSHGEMVITGSELTVPDAAWTLLPRGRTLSLRLRRLPTTATDDPADLPSSAGLLFRRR